MDELKSQVEVKTEECDSLSMNFKKTTADLVTFSRDIVDADAIEQSLVAKISSLHDELNKVATEVNRLEKVVAEQNIYDCRRTCNCLSANGPFHFANTIPRKYHTNCNRWYTMNRKITKEFASSNLISSPETKPLLHSKPFAIDIMFQLRSTLL